MIRTGIVGCGGMTTTGGHVRGFQQLMEEGKCKVTSTCDILLDLAKGAAEILGAGHYTTDWKEMVDSGEYGRVMSMSIWTEQLTITPKYGWGSTARLGGGHGDFQETALMQGTYPELVNMDRIHAESGISTMRAPPIFHGQGFFGRRHGSPISPILSPAMHRRGVRAPSAMPA